VQNEHLHKTEVGGGVTAIRRLLRGNPSHQVYIYRPEEQRMNKWIPAAFLALALTASAGAQSKPQQAAPPFSSWLKNAYMSNRDNISRSAAKVPENLYGMRPGPQAEVRTFGQILGHLATFNYLWCSQAKGEKDPNQGKDLEKLTSKADLTKALSGAFAYCDSVYSSLTDASAQESIQVTQEDGKPAQVKRLTVLVLNYGHNNEHYGNLVSYMRIKSIVPASSEPQR
jgi:uncharacterized damage-inducible protein DinB